MDISIIAFTSKGHELALKVRELLNTKTEYEANVYSKEDRKDISLQDFVAEEFEKKNAIIFIGAMGIAVRTIAPLVKDKLSDSPVINMDEIGNFVIPVLSGHVGGANMISEMIAELLGATPVITTATDINGAFSCDLWAKEKQLKIVNREGIAKVSTKALEGKAVTISIKDYPPTEKVDILVTDESLTGDMGIEATLTLKKRRYVLGVGLKKGKSYEELRGFLDELLKDNNIANDDIALIATIDIKKDEQALIELSKELSCPIVAYEAAVLAKVKGEFSHSDFVETTVGVGNVCERAAFLGAMNNSELVVKKTAKDGMTLAIAKGDCGIL